MKFSVLIAHYNNSEYFKDCYQSLQKQTYQNWEAIILDDASKPEEKLAIKQLIANDNRFKFYENKINSGVGFTKSKLIELATGDICGFVDPDDAILPSAIEELTKCYHSTNAKAVYSQFFICDDLLKPQFIFNSSEQVKNNNPNFFNIFFEVNHFFSFKRATYFEGPQLNTDLRSSIDQDLYLKLYEKGNFIFVKKPLYLYRKHQKGVSQDLKKKELLRKNWNQVLSDSLQRRNIKKIYDQDVESIKDLATFIFQHQNTLNRRLLKKIKILFQKLQ